MSEATTVVKIVPSEFQYQHRKVQTAYLGPITRTWQQYVATSGNSSSAIQFNVTTQSKRVIVRKNLLIWYPIFVSFTGTPIGPVGGPYTLFQTSTGDAPRFMPVSQNVTSFSASIGNASVQIQNSGTYIEAMSRYFMTIQERNKNMGTFPSYPDPLGAGYSTSAQDPGCYNAFTGTAKDPFLNGDQGRDHRGDFTFYLNPINFIGNAAGQTQTAYFTSVEPLMGLSIFGQTSTSLTAGFANVDNITLQISLQNPLNFWSHDITKLSGLTYTSGFYAAPTILVEYWTPPSDMQPMTPLYYPYSAITQYPQNATGTIASGAQFTVVFNNIQVSSVPNALYCFCKAAPGQQLSSVAGEVAGSIYAMDNYAGAPLVPFNSLSGPTPNMGSLQVTFDNSASQLAGMTVQQIYNMCVANGLENTSYSDFCDFGYVLKIFFGKDIFITNTNIVAGSTGSYNMSVQATFQNNYSQGVQFIPMLILVQDGHLLIGDMTNSLDVGSITPYDLARSQAIVGETSQKGAGLFGTIAGTVTSLLPYVSEYSGIARSVGNVVDRLANTQWKGEGGAMYYDPRKRLRNMGGYSIH